MRTRRSRLPAGGRVGAGTGAALGIIAGILLLKLFAVVQEEDGRPVAGGLILLGWFILIVIAVAATLGGVTELRKGLLGIFFFLIAGSAVLRTIYGHGHEYDWVRPVLEWVAGWPRFLTPVIAAIAWSIAGAAFAQQLHRQRAEERQLRSRDGEFDAWLGDLKNRRATATGGADGHGHEDAPHSSSGTPSENAEHRPSS